MQHKYLTGMLATLAMVVVSSMVGCGGEEPTPAATVEGTTPATVESGDITTVATPSGAAPRRLSNAPAQETQIRLRTSKGDILIRLYNDRAPRTVENFLDYARDGFYDGTVVHHAESNLVIAGGCTTDMELKPTRFPILNEANNGLVHRRGTVAMARLPESAHSATSQFFINITDNPAFNHQGTDDARFGYCVFGEVISGMEIVEQMGAVQTGPQGDFTAVPKQQIVLEAVEDVAYIATEHDGTPLLR